ncbi:MAG: NADH-dependent alcohol dehydrogenase, partial [Plesiomonas shigelloides]
MESFVFYNPTEVLFGQQQIARLAERIPADARILITYGGGSVIRFGTLDEVRQALHKHTFFEFGG